jgi:hypothetical protein
LMFLLWPAVAVFYGSAHRSLLQSLLVLPTPPRHGWWAGIASVNMLQIHVSTPLGILYATFEIWDMLWRSGLRHCTTSWKVALSIVHSVTGIFHWHILLAARWPWLQLSL